MGDARDAAAETLARAGCDAPRLDAELLLAHALGTDRATLVTGRGRVLDGREHGRLEALVARRAAREPLAYILGRRGFRHIEVAVDRRVLVPRPETELLVEAALRLADGAAVVDVGTGSGAVALALKHERPDLRVSGTDSSPGALAVARANAARLGLEARFRRADLLAGVPRPIDAVVANVPYVADRDLRSLAPEIVRHEPPEALAGGPDGLDVIRRLAAQAVDVPWLALEVGLGQAPAVARLLRSGGRTTRTLRDLAGIQRVVAGWRA